MQRERFKRAECNVMNVVSSGYTTTTLYPLNFAKLLMASISFRARIQIRIETFVSNVFFQENDNILSGETEYFCVFQTTNKDVIF